MLHCMCLDYKKREEDPADSFEELLNLYVNAQNQGPSLLNLEERIDVEQLEKAMLQDYDS